jgi:hypothetical protein
VRGDLTDSLIARTRARARAFVVTQNEIIYIYIHAFVVTRKDIIGWLSMDHGGRIAAPSSRATGRVDAGGQ